MTKTLKCTPGPWTIPDDRQARQAIIASGGVPIRAYCRSRDMTLALFQVAHNAYFEPDVEVTLANARLVASAPDLLVAACALLEKDTAENWNRLREVVAKAEGR